MTNLNSARAHSPEQKRAVIERLYEAWLREPELRFGQLLFNALPSESRPEWKEVRAMDEATLYREVFEPSLAAHPLAQVEDAALADRVEAFVRRSEG